MNSALIIFAREPKDGKTKTRLLKRFPVKLVTRFYKDFVKTVLKTAHAARCNRRFIYYAGTGSSISFLRRFENKFVLKRQMGQGLGVRMYRAFKACAKQGFDKMIIIGTDCLSLTKKDIQKAFEKLEQYDCVLGPSKDGGYYLIGLKSPHKELFENIQWSTDSVFDHTIKKLERLNKNYYLLRRQEDVDTIESLLRNKSYVNIEIPNEYCTSKNWA